MATNPWQVASHEAYSGDDGQWDAGTNAWDASKNLAGASNVDWSKLGYSGPTIIDGPDAGDSGTSGTRYVSPEFSQWLNDNGYNPGEYQPEAYNADRYMGVLDKNGNPVEGSTFFNHVDDSQFWNMAMLGAGIISGGAATAAGMGGAGAGAVAGATTGFGNTGTLQGTLTGAATGAIGGGALNTNLTGNAAVDAALNKSIAGGANAALRGQNIGQGIESGLVSGAVNGAVNNILPGGYSNSNTVNSVVSGALTSALQGKPINTNSLITSGLSGLIKNLSKTSNGPADTENPGAIGNTGKLPGFADLEFGGAGMRDTSDLEPTGQFDINDILNNLGDTQVPTELSEVPQGDTETQPTEEPAPNQSIDITGHRDIDLLDFLGYNGGSTGDPYNPQPPNAPNQSITITGHKDPQSEDNYIPPLESGERPYYIGENGPEKLPEKIVISHAKDPQFQEEPGLPGDNYIPTVPTLPEIPPGPIAVLPSPPPAPSTKPTVPGAPSPSPSPSPAPAPSTYVPYAVPSQQDQTKNVYANIKNGFDADKAFGLDSYMPKTGILG